MRNPFPENEALFGTDHSGAEYWFCWRLTHGGCRGKLGRFHARGEVTGILDGDGGRWNVMAPCIELDKRFHLHKGTWRINSRGAIRSKSDPTVLSLRADIKRHQNLAAGCRELTEIEDAQIYKEGALMDREVIHSYARHEEWRSSVTLHAGFKETFSELPELIEIRPTLPARVECPACKAINRIQSLRGPIKVRDGKLLQSLLPTSKRNAI